MLCFSNARKIDLDLYDESCLRIYCFFISASLGKFEGAETDINDLKHLDKYITFCYLLILVEYFSNTSSIDLVFLDHSCL